MRKFNHLSKIKETQPGKLLSIIPGMVITFRYTAPNITDRNPILVFFYYDRINGLLEGLNLNYLDNMRFGNFFEGIARRTSVYTADEDTSNLLSEDYTFISIPPIAKLQTRSRAESIVEMRRLYKRFVSPAGQKGFADVYRSYKPQHVDTLKIVNLKDY